MREAQPTYGRSRDVSQGADCDLEREANVFGAELLMPEAAVRQVWDGLGQKANVSSMSEEAVRTVAASFDVSTSAMWYRLFSFALVPTKPSGGDA